jgi:hypothetical protein
MTCRRRGGKVQHLITEDTVRAGVADGPVGAKPVTPGLDLERAAMAVLDASQGLRRQLDAYDAVVRKSLDAYRSGVRVGDLIRAMPSTEVTIGSELDAVGVFEARRGLRRALVAALLADGIPVDEIAATFKVSIASVCDFANGVRLPLE